MMTCDHVQVTVSCLAAALARCGNINWARRTECNVCREPKLGKVEARTGLGGGYNEREDVEYIERAESDDEFDEVGGTACVACMGDHIVEVFAQFGRKKKRKIAQKESSAQTVSLFHKTPPTEGEGVDENEEHVEEEEEDEDEDEEGEEDDASKYDLFAGMDDTELLSVAAQVCCPSTLLACLVWSHQIIQVPSPLAM